MTGFQPAAAAAGYYLPPDPPITAAERANFDTFHGPRTQTYAVFVAGDDDQSVYSFRFASPAGIQNFRNTYAASGLHLLTDGFRCTPTVLAAGVALIGAHPGPNRVAKTHTSLCTASNPPVQGTVLRWRFNTARAEALAIAASCRDLVAAGMNHREISILLNNQRVLLRPLLEFAFLRVARNAGRKCRAGLFLIRFPSDTTDPCRGV